MAHRARRQRLALRVHLLMCRHCRRYAAQIQAIGMAARSLFREQGQDPKGLERLQERILTRRDTTPGSGEVER